MTGLATHIFDTHAEADGTNGTTCIHARSINDCGLVLSQIVGSQSSGFCCLADAELVPRDEKLNAAIDRMEAAGAAIGVLPNDRHPDLAFIWKRLPSALAGFVMPPESRGSIVIDSSRLNQTPSPCETVDWPLQELVIRTALQTSEAVIIAGADDSADDSPLPAASSKLPALAPRHPGNDRRWMSQRLSQLIPQQHFKSAGDDCENTAIVAGLFQLNDYLDESHNHSQSIEGQGTDANGDYWHGIMHRREPDYGNAKYWFRRVGDHPCFSQLAALAEQALHECTSPDADHWKSRLVAASRWDAAGFVDLCETAERSSDDELKIAARRIQWAEMLLLLEHTYQQASSH